MIATGDAAEASVIDIRPVVDEGLGNASWMVGLGDGRALVVDPARDPSPYVAEAERAGWTIAMAVETHLHADFVSGSNELAASGSTVIAPRASGLGFDHRGLADGDELDVGGLTLRALATPGHTPEHLAYLLSDGPRPLALFSGGSLLVGAAARTDLIDPARTEELARDLYRSITTRLMALPDDLAVFPTHGAGSFCSAAGSSERTTTVGAERARNPLLAAGTEDAFVERLLASLGTYPPYFLTLRELNRRGPQIVGATPQLARLTVNELRGLVDQGAQVVDARPVGDFANRHLPGSLSIPLRPQFASWLGWLVEAGRPVAFVVGPDQDRRNLVRQCLGIGYERLAGELDGGVVAWQEAGLPLESLAVVGAPTLGLPGSPGRLLLDVRQTNEYAAGHIPGSLNVELGSLADSVAQLPAEPLAVLCGHGERAVTGASILSGLGRHDVEVVTGGPDDWAAAPGRQLTSGD